jgi:hypothetical protein
MSKVFKVPLKPPTLNSDPSGTKGDFYYNNIDKAYRYHDGTGWQKWTGTSGSVTIIDGGAANSTYIYNLDGGGA